MDRRRSAIVILIVVFVSTTNYLTFYNVSQTQFHYEETFPETWISGSNIRLFCSSLRDTNVTIIFRNDKNLWYSIDITLYKPSHPSRAFTFQIPRIGSLRIFALQRIESVRIVLGTGGYHDIFINGKNLNASVTYSNGVVLGNSTEKDSTGTFLYSATGELYFTLNEDVDCSEGGVDVIVGHRSPEGTWLYPDKVYLDVDVPDFLSGNLKIYDPTTRYFLENIGWYYDGNYTESDSGDLFHRYRTHNSREFHQPYHLYFKELRAGTLFARLKT